MKFLRFALSLIFFAAVLPALAQPEVPGREDAKVVAWLKSGDFRALDNYFAAFQSRYESGQLDDWSLLVLYQPFYDVSPENEARLTTWVNAAPKSYAARLARGVYYRKVGEDKRGGAYAYKTSRQQMADLHKYLEWAESDLRASMNLSDKPILSVVHLLNISMHRSDASANRHWLLAGNRIDPKNFAVRRRYMLTLRPRWGGSYTEMETFLSQSKKEGVPLQHARIFESMIYSDEANLGEKTQPERALALYRKSLDLLEPSPLSKPERYEALRGYIRVSHTLTRIEHALPEINEFLKEEPDDAYVVRMRAWAYERQNKLAESWVEYQRAAALKDAWSQYIVGRTYYLGKPGYVEPNKEMALKFLRAAKENGSKEAKQFLDELPGAERERGAEKPRFPTRSEAGRER